MSQAPAPATITPLPAHSRPLRYTHEAMIDLIIQDPTVTTGELAQVFNLSSGWCSRVINSDAFQARLAERKAVLVDPTLKNSLNERLRSVAMQAVDLVGEKLQAEQSASYAIDALQVVAKAMA